MSEERIEASGLESNFIKSWEGWDELDITDIHFYDCELRPEAFPPEFVERIDFSKRFVCVMLCSQNLFCVLEETDSGFTEYQFKIKSTLEYNDEKTG